MNLYVLFMKEIEKTQPGATDHVSEVDISDVSDVRVTLTGMGAAPGSAAPILVHFGDSDFGNRYHLLAENIDQWRAGAGSVDSVDLRFARQVVVNPESKAMVTSVKQEAPPRVATQVARHSARRAPQRVKVARKRR
jgi:cell division protein FtsQ